jgi:TM2 domain-containing membrane protein YozV
MVGVIYTLYALSGLGILLLLFGVYSWAFQPAPGPPALVSAADVARATFVPGHVPSWVTAPQDEE